MSGDRGYKKMNKSDLIEKMASGADISKAASSYEVLNPDQEICTVSKKVKFSIELKIEKGRGYVSSEENNNSNTFFRR